MANPILKQRLMKGELIFSTGVWDELSALIVEKAGFDVLHFGSTPFTATLGLPDIGIVGPKQVCEKIYGITEHTQGPLIVDFESGWGGVMQASYWAKQFEKAGATAIHIDDYGEVDKCPWLPPHLPSLEKPEAVADKIKAICDSRGSDNFLVIARSGASYSSAFKTVEEGLEEGLRRVRLWKDAGADLIWGRAATVEGLRKYREVVKGPLCTQIGIPKTRKDRSPGVDGLTVKQIFDMGYQLILSGLTLLPVVLKTLLEIGTEFRIKRDVHLLRDKAMGFEEMEELVGFNKLLALRKKFGRDQ